MISVAAMREWLGDPYAAESALLAIEAGVVGWLQRETNYYLGLPANRTDTFDGPPIPDSGLSPMPSPVRRIYLHEVPTDGTVSGRFWQPESADWSDPYPDSAFRYSPSRELLQRAWVEFIDGDWPVGKDAIEMTWGAGYPEDRAPPLVHSLALRLIQHAWRARATDFASRSGTEGFSISYQTLSEAGLIDEFNQIRPTRDFA